MSSRGTGDGLAPRLDLDHLYTQEVDGAIRKGIGFLTRHIGQWQFNQGKGLERVRPEPNPGIVGIIGLAFLNAGGQPERPPLGEYIDLCLDYILSCVGEGGFIHDRTANNYGPMYEHGFATLFLAECYGASLRREIRSVLANAIELIIRTQNDRGGWRYHPVPADADLSVTVCQMMALRAARNAGFFVPVETMERGLDYVRRCQNSDGGFAYQLTGGPSRWPLTAAAIVAIQNAGKYQDPALDRAYEYLLQRRREVAIPTQTNYFFYAHYYAVQAFWQRGGEAWREWYRGLRETLLPLQSPEGSWLDSISRVYGTAMSCLILSVPRGLLPIFQK